MKTALSITILSILLLAFALLPAIAQEGPDEVESNNTKNLADSVSGLLIEGEIGRGDDSDDWFMLEGQEGYNPSFTIRFDDEELEVDWEVYSGDEVVASSLDYGSPETLTARVPSTCYIHVWWWSGQGDYEIEIEPADTENISDCAGDDEIEPNDTEDLADSIDGLTIDGYACEGDIDWFVLEGQEGRRPMITLRYDEDECDIDLDVWSGDELVGSLTSTDSPDSDEFRIPETCMIMVTAYEGEGEYEIEIEP